MNDKLIGGTGKEIEASEKREGFETAATRLLDRSWILLELRQVLDHLVDEFLAFSGSFDLLFEFDLIGEYHGQEGEVLEGREQAAATEATVKAKLEVTIEGQLFEASSRVLQQVQEDLHVVRAELHLAGDVVIAASVKALCYHATS